MALAESGACGRFSVAPDPNSPGGTRLFARAEPGGTLRVWDTATGRLAQEYAPSAHLTATCCCLAWAAVTSKHAKSPKKKRMSGVVRTEESQELVAMGTTSGSIVVYSVTKADVDSHMADGHSDRVSGLCWSADCKTIYSCSTDRHIVEWDYRTASVRHKWKGDKGLLYSIHLCHTQRHLLTASRAIKLWDLDTRLVLQTFVGHASEVFSLCQVPSYASIAAAAESQTNGSESASLSIEGSYIISSAIGDRKISVWQVSSGVEGGGVDTSGSTSGKDVTASFSLPDDPVEIHVRSPMGENQPFQLAALTVSGKLSLFEHVLNGRQKKPLKPRCSVELATNVTRSAEVPRPLPIVAVGLATDPERSIIIAYEDFIRPVFEKLRTSDLKQQTTCLVRDDPIKTAGIALRENVSRVKTPQVSKDLTVLAPGYMAPAGPVRLDDGSEPPVGAKKRRKSTEMTLEERLNAIDSTAEVAPSRSKVGGQQTPKTDSLATLLEQGLQSRDKKILNNVLQRTDAVFIRSTVSRLSPSVIVLLVKELTRRMQGHAQSQRTVLQWTNIVMTTHKSFLTSLPDVDELLQPLRQIMYTPTELLERLMQVNAQLKSFLSQGSAATQESLVTSQQPLSSYKDESSDDELLIEEENHVEMLSEEDWESSEVEGSGAEEGASGEEEENEDLE